MPHTLVVLADAHVGPGPSPAEASLLAFLDLVPSRGDALLIGGDLFQFWFAWRHAIPRRAFPVAARLAALARRVPVMIVGGNHDRWGAPFWNEVPGIRYHPRSLRFPVGGRRVRAVHGDGVAARRGVRPALQRMVNHPATSAVYRWVHPDVGVPLAHRAAPLLGGGPATAARRAERARAQRAWAEAELAEDPSTDLLIMAHTHVPALLEVGDGRTYLNPGAWAEGLRYAVVSEPTIELLQFDG